MANSQSVFVIIVAVALLLSFNNDNSPKDSPYSRNLISYNLSASSEELSIEVLMNDFFRYSFV